MFFVLEEHENNAPCKPKLGFIQFEDTTPEALFDELNQHDSNAGLCSSEGAILLNGKIMSKTAPLNSFWSDDDITITRKTVESFTLEGVRLTILIMVQPSAFAHYLQKTKDDVRGNGLMSRFLHCEPESNCGNRLSMGITYNCDGLELYNARLEQLLGELAKRPANKDKLTIRLSNEAIKIWYDVSNDIEFKMGPGGVFQYAKDHASKLPENILRLAAIIHLFDESSALDISANTLLESINLMSYFSGQFMKIFCPKPKHLVDIENLNQWFFAYTSSGVRYVKRNHILQFGPPGTRKKRDLDVVLSNLLSQRLIGECFYVKTRVIDMLPHLPYVPDKLVQDMTSSVIL
jgi:hypothetical protein